MTCFTLIGPLGVGWTSCCSLIAACWHSPSALQNGLCKNNVEEIFWTHTQKKTEKLIPLRLKILFPTFWTTNWIKAQKVWLGSNVYWPLLYLQNSDTILLGDSDKDPSQGGSIYSYPRLLLQQCLHMHFISYFRCRYKTLCITLSLNFNFRNCLQRKENKTKLTQITPLRQRSTKSGSWILFWKNNLMAIGHTWI